MNQEQSKIHFSFKYMYIYIQVHLAMAALNICVANAITYILAAHITCGQHELPSVFVLVVSVYMLTSALYTVCFPNTLQHLFPLTLMVNTIKLCYLLTRQYI